MSPLLVAAIPWALQLAGVPVIPENWDTADKIGATIALALEASDWNQTKKIARNPDRYYEDFGRSYLGRHPSVADVNRHFLLSTLAGYALLRNTDDPMMRKMMLGGGIGLEGTMVENNRKIGLGRGGW